MADTDTEVRRDDGSLDRRFKANRAAIEKEDLVELVRDRHRIMTEADFHNRRDAMADIKFVNIRGHQWQNNMKQERGNRPCYEYNKVKIRTKRVVNDIRDNRPSGKVRAVEGGDIEIAEIYEGLIRNVWNVSHGDNATDYAAEYQVEGGMGAWRVNTELADDTFDQDIIIEMIENPFNLYSDPRAKDFMKRDAADWILHERISHQEFDERWPGAEKINFEETNRFDTGNDDDWWDEDSVRIAEYWYKVPVKKELWLIDTPDPADPKLKKTIIVDSDSDEAAAMKKQGFKPTKKRTVDAKQIMMVIASGKEILEGPVKWAGRLFPFVMVFGEYKVIDGRKYWWGLVRNAKDAQRNYNISKTAIAETIHQAPKAFSWMTPVQAKGLEDQNAEAHKKNFPIKYYNPDREAPGPPSRVGPADVPVALMSQAAIDDADLKDVMGVPDESVGQQTNASSGRAIFARQQQGEIANFNYKDNHAKGHELTYEILIDMIPEIYDTERELRILGSDGAEDYVRINQVVFDPDSGKSIRVNDLAAGKYDVTVKTGPSFATLRQEAAEVYSAMGQQFPAIWSVAGDLIMENMDLPGADDIAERMRSLLPPEIQQRLNEDTEIPPEVAQLMQQAQVAMAQVQEQGLLVQEAAQELEGEQVDNEKLKAEISVQLSNVDKAKAEFDTHVAQAMLALIKEETGLITKDAGLDKKDANLTKKEAEVKTASFELDQKAIEMGDVIEASDKTTAIDDILARFIRQTDEAHSKILEKLAEHEAKADRKPVGGTVIRKGGKLTAKVEMDDGSSKTINAVREGGQLRIVPDGDTAES